jgi:hypothetical protein
MEQANRLQARLHSKERCREGRASGSPSERPPAAQPEGPLTWMPTARPWSLQTGLTGLQDQSDFLQNLHIKLHIYT